MTLMGGAIGLKSRPGEGTTITFTAHFDMAPESQPAPLSRCGRFAGDASPDH